MSILFLLTTLIPLYTAKKYITEINYGTYWAEIAIGEGNSLKEAQQSLNTRKYYQFAWPTGVDKSLGFELPLNVMHENAGVFLTIKENSGTIKRYIYKGPQDNNHLNTPSRQWMLFDANGNKRIQHTVRTFDTWDLQPYLDVNQLLNLPQMKTTKKQNLNAAATIGYYDQFEYDVDEQNGRISYIPEISHNHRQHYDHYEPQQYLYGNDGSGYGLSFALMMSAMGLCLLCIVCCIGCVMGGGVVYGVSNYPEKRARPGPGYQKIQRVANRIDHSDDDI